MKTATEVKFPLPIGEIMASVLTFKDPRQTDSKDRKVRHVLADRAMHDSIQRERMDTDCQFINGHYFEDTWDKSKWFIFFVADCFSPPTFLIRADTFESAYEAFCDEFGEQMQISPEDLADYGENYSVNNEGMAIDTESVQGFEVILESVIV